MYPFRRILIPTDFSTASEWVFDDAVRIAVTTGAEIIILHIRMTWQSHPDELRFPADPSLYEYAERHELERVRDRVRRSNATVPTRLAVMQGPNPGAEIAKYAAGEDVDLIVIATHARHHVAHLLIGSTTLSVIKEPPAPVLAMRYGIRKRGGRMKKMVVPVHPPQTTHAALDLALAINAREGGEVHLLTICGEADRKAAEALLGELSARSPNIRQTFVRGTDVEREIIRYAARGDADVIFLNARQKLSAAKENIVRHASTPVMVVPSPGP
ncbi:MAG TPA: universal stress protein [Thermoanaerobaculia bacterium]|nr:universal stress protein [Thermoanaerobaculia bacterium]